MSEVHTSLLEPVLLFKQVPYWAGVANWLGGLIAAVGFRRWNLLILTAFMHVVMMVLTQGDPQRVRILVRHLMTRVRLLWCHSYGAPL